MKCQTMFYRKFENEQTTIIVLSVDLQIRVCTRKLFFLILNQNICCGYSKEPSH